MWVDLWPGMGVGNIGHHSYFKYAFTRENIVNKHFQMALSWWGKGLWHICMLHWRVHAKVKFPRFPPDVRTRKGRSIIFHHGQAKSELKNVRWDPGQSDGGQSSFNFWSWTQKCKFFIDIFMGFPAILSTLQPFQIYIDNRKYSKLTFSNGSQLMGKRFMAHLHGSLKSTCKSRISKISTTCQNQEGGQSSFTMSRLNLNWKILGEIGILVSQMGGFNHLSTFDPELRNVSFALISLWGFLQY